MTFIIINTVKCFLNSVLLKELLFLNSWLQKHSPFCGEKASQRNVWSTYSGFERASLCLVTTDFCKTVRNSTDSAPRTKLIPGFWWRGHDQDFYSPMGNTGGHWDVNLFLTSSITLCLPGIDKARGISERIWVEFNAALWECSLSSPWRRSHQVHFHKNLLLIGSFLVH